MAKKLQTSSPQMDQRKTHRKRNRKERRRKTKSPHLKTSPPIRKERREREKEK